MRRGAVLASLATLAVACRGVLGIHDFPVEDGGTDSESHREGGTSDSGADASLPDSGRDAGVVTGHDAGHEGGTDAGRDAGHEAGPDDAGRDAGHESGSDAAHDAKSDAEDAAVASCVAACESSNGPDLGAFWMGLHTCACPPMGGGSAPCETPCMGQPVCMKPDAMTAIPPPAGCDYCLGEQLKANAGCAAAQCTGGCQTLATCLKGCFQ